MHKDKYDALQRGLDMIYGPKDDAPMIEHAAMYGDSDAGHDRYCNWRDSLSVETAEDLYQEYMLDHGGNKPDGEWFDEWLEEYYMGHRD